VVKLEPPPRRRRPSRWPLRLTLLAFAAAVVVLVPRLTAKKPVPVKTVRVERGMVRDVVSSSTAGEVAPLRKATVRAELGARVTAVKHVRGDRVRRGDAVVLLDAADLDARVAQAQATLGAQAAAVAQAQARALQAERTAARAQALADKGAGTTQLSEDSTLGAREAKEAVNAAKGLLAQSEAALRVARVARGKAELDAPFDGVLVEVHPDPGEELAPGTPVFEIIDDTRLHVDAAVDEADVARIRIDQPASLTLDALPGRTVEARLSKVAPAVRKDLKGARTLPIEVEVADVGAARDIGLRSGMSANVEIVVAEKANVVSLPTNVVVGHGAKRSVFVVDGGRAHVRAVEIGISNWDKTEIVSGVREGEEVVATLNSKDLEDNAAVKVGALP
jgi:HlyD family secretion protein